MRANSGEREEVTEDFDFENTFDILAAFSAELGDEDTAALIRTLAEEVAESDEEIEEPAEDDELEIA